ncbi:MAG: family 78 glycoside hydrolase catalytic domain [Bacteroidia bacterium]
MINHSNKYDNHQFYLESIFGVVEIYLDGKDRANLITPKSANPSPFAPKGVNLNPYGSGGDFICFPLLADIGFSVPANQKAAFSNVQVRHFRQPSNVIFSEDLTNAQTIFSKSQSASPSLTISNQSYQVEGQPDGTLITANPSKNAAPMLRTEFQTANRTIQKARLYVTARGIYEMYLNGKRVGDDYFNPGLTQYNKTHFYQTYDVSDFIEQGKNNALGAWLSEGWWSGNITFRGENWNFFGDRQSLLCKLVITYSDGSQEVITSDPEKWKIYTEGPIRYGSFFQGEVYDATKEAAIAGWTQSGFKEQGWKPTVAVPLEGTASKGSFTDFAGRTIPLPYDKQEITAQIGENVKIVKTMTAKSVEEVRPGVFIYDMGQNMVGFPSIQLDHTAKGKTIRLRYAEVKYPNLPEYKGNTGMIMLENIRAALTQDIYITKGGGETIQPRFTFHGFRFLEISGVDEALPLEKVQVKC